MNTNNIHYQCDDNCNFECENANQCDHYNYNNDIASFNLIQQQNQQQSQNFADENYQYYSNNGVNFNSFDDSVVPSNFYENNNESTSFQSYQLQQQRNYSLANFNSNVTESVANINSTPTLNSYSSTIYATNYNYTNAESLQTHPPCDGPQPWNFAQCYGYYGDAPCQFANVIDMEDFM